MVELKTKKGEGKKVMDKNFKKNIFYDALQTFFIHSMQYEI